MTVADAEDAMQRKAVLYDKAGDQHYDYISAWIKSTRGSDPDASLYYLAAMLEGGEDPRYIARRMIVLASEDIGNADPQALPIAMAAAHAVEHVGFPECQFALAQAAIYLSLAPKSNAAKRAILGARAHIAERGAEPPPGALRNAAIPAMRKMGRGVGYENPHDAPGHVNDQEHLPGRARGHPLLRARRRGGGVPRAARRAAAGARPRAVSDGALRHDRPVLRRDAERGPADRRRDPAARSATRGRCSTSAPGPAPTSRADRDVTAVEPSAVMRAQRPPGAAPCVDARAEALPFGDGEFDAAMAVLSDHHWADRRRRAARAAPGRAARGRVPVGSRLPRRVLARATTSPSFGRGLEDWFDEARAALGAPREIAVPIPHDCRDGFLMAYWRRPEAYLDPVVRANISVFALAPPDEVDAMVDRAARRPGAAAPGRQRHAALLDARRARPRLPHPRRRMTPEELRRRRAAAQLLAGDAHELPGGGAHLLAVQAQDLRAARLALRARGAAGSAADVDAALADGALVVAWLLRGTLHLVARDDYALAACADRRPDRRDQPAAARAGSASPDPQRGVAVIERALEDGPLDRSALAERLVRPACPPTARPSPT